MCILCIDTYLLAVKTFCIIINYLEYIAWFVLFLTLCRVSQMYSQFGKPSVNLMCELGNVSCTILEQTKQIRHSLEWESMY